jgi:hypothetical protein
MISRYFLLIVAVLFFVAALPFTDGQDRAVDRAAAERAVEKVLHSVFGWAVTKDFDRFYGAIADDEDFISVTPYDRVKFGITAVKESAAFWASPDFKAISHEIRDLRVRFARCGEVAWFYCVVDDFNTWKGEPANWENVRWTGVLEKRNGAWRVVQQHFSWPRER